MFIEFGDNAQGKIEARDDQQERLQEFTERLLAGEFHTEIRWDETLGKMILVRCVDGRTPDGEPQPLGPNSAGATESLFVADDLTTKRFKSEDGTTLGGYKNTVNFLVGAGYAVGGHTGEHAHDNVSDCGANDKLGPIYSYMTENADVLRKMAKDLGVNVSDETHNLIIGNASARTQFSAGKELLDVTKANAKKEFYDNVQGNHNEVIVAINTEPGTTLDRTAIKQEFGPSYQAFNVDVWAFPEAAQAISITEEEAEQKTVALTYYNLATALVLSGGKMRVGTVDYALAA
jgi:hypothetical protein